jgi:Cys-tRNA synthase (O-phospho-L-seryl-tRNA:Cys-tRNA synthase)
VVVIHDGAENAETYISQSFVTGGQSRYSSSNLIDYENDRIVTIVSKYLVPLLFNCQYSLVTIVSKYLVPLLFNCQYSLVTIVSKYLVPLLFNCQYSLVAIVSMYLVPLSFNCQYSHCLMFIFVYLTFHWYILCIKIEIFFTPDI